MYRALVTTLTVILIISISGFSAWGQQERISISKLENPITVSYLQKKLKKSSPRLVLNGETERNLRKKLKSDPVVQNMYNAVRLNAQSVFDKSLLERKLVGRRLLGTSRELLWRMNMLGLIYRLEKEERVLNRINEELLAVCNFSDWNPSHYLDVAEMAMGVAIALDWTAGDLPEETQRLAIDALIQKGIKPSWEGDTTPGWAYGTNNWNQVCNGGMIAASIAIAEAEPELAAKTIHRALDGLPYSLAEYGPDGVYPEGSTYWRYGTSFSVVTIAMLESAFGTDFGMGEYTAFQESATFRVLCNAPSGRYYNFADCGDKRGQNGDITLAWFAAKTGNKNFFEGERFLRDPEKMGKLGRLAGAGLVWLAQYQEKEDIETPNAWKGEGANPIVIFTGGKNDPQQYYFGGKGGRGMVNHGNMDGGSFIFELNGVRWVVDPGNQPYHELEKTGFDLWDRCQECERWSLLTKNNFGHSTLTVNDELHSVEGMVRMVEFKDGSQPEAVFDLTSTLGGLVASAKRRFVKESNTSLLIADQLEINENTRMITWQLMTQARVEFFEGGVILHQDGKSLKVENLSQPSLTASIVNLDPPPLQLDRKIENLKRIEFNYPAYLFKDGKEEIKIRLSSD